MNTNIFRSKYLQYSLIVLALAGLYFILSTIITWIIPVKQIKVPPELLYSVNESISNSTDGLRNDCRQAFASIEQQMKNNPYKVKQFKEKADSVQQAVDLFLKKIEKYSNLLVQENGGWRDEKAYEDINDFAVMKGNYLVHERNSVGALGTLRDKNGAEELYQLMLITQQQLLKAVDDPRDKVKLKANLPLKIDNNDEKTISQEEWLQQNFHSVPLINEITFLNKLQNDAIASERLVLFYLLKCSTPITDFITRMQPEIIAATSNVHQGDTYSADIFLIEFNPSIRAKISIGRLNSLAVKDDDGSYVETRENPVNNGILIPCANGFGKYSVSATELGIHHYAGAVEITGPDGAPRYYPFEGEYSVGKKCD